MSKFLIISVFFCLAFSALQAQNQKKNLSKIKGVELIYIPKGSEVEKARLKVGDIIISYAGVPTPERRALITTEMLLIQLEQQWKKAGTPLDFWTKKASWIKKKTKGVEVKPTKLLKQSSRTIPVYSLKFWSKNSEKEMSININCGLFYIYFVELKKRKDQGYQFYLKGMNASKKNQLEEAVLNFKTASKIYTELKDLQKASVNLNSVGSIYSKQGKFALALEYLQKSLELNKQLGNPTHIAFSLNNIGSIYKSQGKSTLALEYFQKALKLRKQLGNSANIASTLNQIGVTYLSLGKSVLALKNLQESLELREKLRNPVHIAESLNNIGVFYQNQGKLEEALKYFQKSLELYKQIKDLPQTALSLSNIGIIYHDQGKFELGLQHFQESLKIREQLKNPIDIAVALNNIGGIYNVQGKRDLALEYFHKSLKLKEQLGGNPLDLAISLNNVGSIYEKQKKHDLAFSYFQRSLKLFQGLGKPVATANVLNNIGGLCNSIGSPEQALKYFKESLKLCQQVGDPAETARVLNNIGVIYKNQGKLEQALKSFQKALQLNEQVGNPVIVTVSLNSIGEIYRSQGKLELGNSFSLKAVEKISYIANQSGSGRNSYFKEHLHEYAHTIESVYSAHPVEAFKTLQYCKGFGFITTLSELNLSLEQNVDQNILKEKDSLSSKISTTYKLIKEHTKNKKISPEIISKKKQELLHLEKELENVIDKIRVGNPAYANIQYPKPATVQEIQSILKENEVFLEYFCAPKEHGYPGHTYCFVIEKNSFKVIRLGLTSSLNNSIQNFRLTLWDSQEEDEEAIAYYAKKANELYQHLIQPVLKEIKEKKEIKNLIIAPDGLINLVPFEALCLFEEKDEEELFHYKDLTYLLDQYKISYILSATVYKHLNQPTSQVKKEGKTLRFFGLGDPLFKESTKGKWEKKTRTGLSPLPGTREELLSITKLFPENQFSLLLGKDSVEPTLFLKDLTKYDVLHFATHGLIDTKKPMHSSLALTQLTKEQQKLFETSLSKKGFNITSCSDGFLTVRDIFELHKNINAKLVVLSACETGTGKIERGDGVVGLTRAFQFSGVPSIIVSLWSVNDESTNQFMQIFYRELLKEATDSLNEKRLNALHHAKKKLRNSKKYSAPFYWAPFILRGKP